MEVLGKWFYIPRTLCDYYYSEDTFSRKDRPSEDWDDVTRERLFIESKFPSLHDEDICSQFLYFLPIETLARDFAIGDFNRSNTRKNILYINSELELFEKQLLKELFFDHNIYFKFNLDIKFDEIIVALNSPTCENLPKINESLEKTNKDTHVKFRLDIRNNLNLDEVQNLIMLLYKSYGWKNCGYEYYFNTAV